MMGVIVEYRIKCKKLKQKVLTNTFDTEVEEQKYNQSYIIPG